MYFSSTVGDLPLTSRMRSARRRALDCAPRRYARAAAGQAQGALLRSRPRPGRPRLRLSTRDAAEPAQRRSASTPPRSRAERSRVCLLLCVDDRQQVRDADLRDADVLDAVEVLGDVRLADDPDEDTGVRSCPIRTAPTPVTSCKDQSFRIVVVGARGQELAASRLIRRTSVTLYLESTGKRPKPLPSSLLWQLADALTRRPSQREQARLQVFLPSLAVPSGLVLPAQPRCLAGLSRARRTSAAKGR